MKPFIKVNANGIAPDFMDKTVFFPVTQVTRRLTWLKRNCAWDGGS